MRGKAKPRLSDAIRFRLVAISSGAGVLFWAGNRPERNLFINESGGIFMAILKTVRQVLLEERRKNEALTAALAKEREKVQFLGLLAADVDVDELMNEEEYDGE